MKMIKEEQQKGAFENPIVSLPSIVDSPIIGMPSGPQI